MIASDKPLKKCHFCGKDVRNLGYHIANVHPNVLSQLDEYAETGKIDSSPQVPQTPPTPQSKTVIPGNINDMIKEKLDTMLNIKIIEMLSKNPDVSIQDLKKALDPPQKTTIQELKEYHDLVYGSEKKDLSDLETGNQWVDVALQALPIVKDAFSGITQKKAQNGGLEDVRARKETNSGILRPISAEIAGNTGKPSSPAQEPGNPGGPEQQNNSGDPTTR